MKPPRISIITPSFNRGALLRHAIESVRQQGITRLEHIVVDGGSTDDTVGILQDPALVSVSEPDHGVYDAINKGVAMARGDIIGLLNTDDVYSPGILQAVIEIFRDRSVDAVYSGAEIFEVRKNGMERVVHRFQKPDEIDLSWRNITIGVGTINARFWSRDFIERVGLFDLKFPISADRDWMIRAKLLNPRSRLLEKVGYRYLLHAGSLTLNHAEPQYREEHLRMTQDYLADNNLSEPAREWICRLHTKETIQGFVSAAYQRQFSKALDQAKLGCRMDCRWPARFAAEAGRAVLRRLGVGK